MYPRSAPSPPKGNFNKRIRFFYTVLLVVVGVFVIRLFYLQVIKHNYYSQVALAGQLKQYEIPALRGTILAHDGNNELPIVLNENLYTLFADPKFIDNPESVSEKVQQIIGGDVKNFENLMRGDTRYAVLAKRLNKIQKQKIDDLNIKGLGTRDEPHRTYPQGSLAAQVLGFVNDDGEGKYGVEQYLNDMLAGKPGELRAITDAQGVPLLSNPDNIIRQPINGKSAVLTIDISMQKQLEAILKKGLENANSLSGSALIMDPNTGAVKAMANLPSYDPAKFFDVKDASVFNDSAVSSPLEVGSVMKTLTVSAALNQGVITPNTTYYDPSHFLIDGYTVKNVEQDGGPGRRSIKDILRLSLNTGATWMLMQMGGGEINSKARDTWYDYLSNHYQLGKPTGIEQGYESPGTIPDPHNGYGLNLRFANSAFGQGLTITPLQLGAALSSVINGGTYYKPHLVDSLIGADGSEEIKAPEIVRTGVVKPGVSSSVRALMEFVVSNNHNIYGMPNLPSSNYIIGGKTGTAEIAMNGGGYYSDRFNGTFVGFVGGDRPQYVIIVRVNQPHVPTFAGAGAAAPIFSRLAEMLISNFYVTPKGQ